MKTPSFLKRASVLIIIPTVLLACSKKDFSPEESIPEKQEVITDFSRTHHFAYKASQDFFQQDQYDRNETSVSFQVLNERGLNVSGLTKTDIELSENNRVVGTLDLSSQSVNLGQKADIVFVIDVTSSMQPTINSVKTKVREFVEKMQQNRIQALLCLVTFRDKTEKKCETIVEDNPQTPQNENLENFLSEVSNLRASGGGDTDENQLRAMMDAAVTPWRSGSQRLAILITDAPFHYQPDNKGNAGSNAPFYTEAMTSVQNSQMTLFAVAPPRDGYNRDFQGNPSLVSLSRGQYFNYSDMVSGVVGMETIFQTIVDRVSTRYMAKYVIEDNPNLDSSESLSSKRFQLRVPGFPQYTVQILGTSSTRPQGHPEFKKQFILSKKARLASKSFSVKVNGQPWLTPVRLEESQVVFEVAPPAGSRVEVAYDAASLKEGLKLKSLVLPSGLEVTSMRVLYNGREVLMEELRLSRDDNGSIILDPAFTVLSEEDPYRVIDRRGLDIVVEGKVYSWE